MIYIAKYLRAIFLLFSLYVILASVAKADYIPGIITVQDTRDHIIGYITTNGEVMDENYNLIGYIRENGSIEGSNSASIGYFDGRNFQDDKFNIIGYFAGNRLANINFYTLGYIGDGRIEGQNYLTVGYFNGNTGGNDWVIAAFCLYYTDMFHHSKIQKEPLK